MNGAPFPLRLPSGRKLAPVGTSVRRLLPCALALACLACGSSSERTSSTSSPGPAPEGIAFSAADAERLEARIDEDPEQAVRFLEQVVATSHASLSEEQFDQLRSQLIELVDGGKLRRLVRAGREAPATSHEVARLLEDLEAWDDSILRGVDGGDMGYYGPDR